jgi:hypothetical protein
MAQRRELNEVAMYDAHGTGVGPVAAETGPTTTEILSGIVGDVQQLVRKEIALVRQETTEELQKAKQAGIALATGGAVLAVGSLLLLLALARGFADLVEWPVWAGYGLVGGILLLTGGILVALARKRAKQIHPVPEITAETMKENVEWLKERTTKK